MRDVDEIKVFIDFFYIEDPESIISAVELHQHYLRWAPTVGVGERSLQDFAAQLATHNRQPLPRKLAPSAYYALRRRKEGEPMRKIGKLAALVQPELSSTIEVQLLVKVTESQRSAYKFAAARDNVSLREWVTSHLDAACAAVGDTDSEG